jgi:hypothetical protein
VPNDASTVTSDKVNTSIPSRRAQNVQVVVLNVAGSSSVTRPKGNARLTAYIRSAQPGGTLRGIEIGTILSNECGKQGTVYRTPFVATRTGDVAPSVIVADPALFETRAGR